MHTVLTEVLICVCMCSIGISSQCNMSPTANNWHYYGENIAFRKQAFQSPDTYMNGQFSANLSVDGSCTAQVSCSHTDCNKDESPNWTVQFGISYQLTGIIIFNRRELQSRLQHFKVHGNCDQQYRMLYDDDQQQQQQYLNNVILIELDGIYSCSTINIQIPQYDGCSWNSTCSYSYLTLCEVRVYAAGTFGCSRPIVPTFGNFFPNKYWYARNETFILNCTDGYKPSSNQPVSCCDHGRFCSQIPHCQIMRCTLPTQPDSGYYSLPANMPVTLPDSYTYGSKIVGKCNTGYESHVRNTVRQCMGDEVWSGKAPVCTLLQCTDLVPVLNGHYVYANNTMYNDDLIMYNTTLLGVCNTGFKLRMNIKLYCNQYGQWNGSTPKCDIVKCKQPDAFDNGYYYSNIKATDYYYNNVLNVICEKGFTLRSAPSKRICESPDRWSGDPPICEQIMCPWPLELPGGYYKQSNDTKNGDHLHMNHLPYSTTLIAICNMGYSLNINFTSRQCNEDGMWSHSPAICLQIVDDNDSNGEASPLGMIVGASTGGVVVIVSITVVGIIICRKRRAGTKPKREFNDIRSTNNQAEGEYAEIQESRFYKPAANSNRASTTKNELYENNSSTPLDDASIPNEDASSHEYYSFQGNKRMAKSALKIEALSDIVLEGDAAKNRFVKEFEKLPHGMVEEHKDALKTENIGKHRYRNLFAYDHSRVVLQKDHSEESDYINACYVNGFSKPREYIASQGPSKEILNDFWRMIWQTDCTKIVMLTKLVEEGKPKCEQYWPDKGAVVYGDITVTLKKPESFSEFVIRTFTVKKANSKTKHVAQFHFTAWPDKGVPKYASSLVQFRNKVKYAPTRGDGPIVVHCSAGVGRTGTFIALDFLTDQANAVGYVDVFGSVEGMRRQRVHLVQTLDQYIFLHHALVETLMLSSSALPSNKFAEWFNSMLQVDHRKKKRKLDIEFETLSKLSPTAEEHQYCTAKQVRNRNKNRYSNVLPVDDFMPQLEPLEDIQGDTTYINAVFLPSYKQKNAFIITQTPLQGTKDDFWRLVWEHDVHVIVMMNNIHETSRAEQYWPTDNESMTSRNITIKHTNSEEMKNHKVETLSLQKYAVTRNLVQVQCGGWQASSKLPDSKDAILSLLDVVQSIQRKTGDQSVLVHCMNGADKSGLFCVISAVIERMKIEQDVAITHVIEEMRNAREQIIPTVEQYQFCHEVVLAYIEDFSTYSNFSL